MVNKIVTVFKTHFDIGFTELVEEILKRYSGKMLQDIIHTCESTSDYGDKKFIWTFAAWVFLQTVQNASEEDRKKAEKLIQNGQFVFHALPYTVHTEFLGLEDLNRICNFAKKASELYGVKMPIAAKMTDVPGHTYFLASVLANAGIKFLHLGINGASKPVSLPMLFWWEGPDGSRVLTFYNKGGYGSSLLPPKDWKFPVWLAVMQSNDNSGPQSPEVIENLEKEIHAKNENIEMVVGTLDDFYREISQYDLSELPVIKADLADSWIHGVGSYPKEVSDLRRNRSRLRSLQTLETILGKTEVNSKIDRIYEKSMMFGEHTWGLDVKTTLGYNRSYEKEMFLQERENFESYHRLEQSWQEQKEYAKTAIRLTDELEEDIDKNFIIHDGKTVTVFNPQAAEQEGFIDFTSVLQSGCGLSDDGMPIGLIQSDTKVFGKAHLKPLETRVYALTSQRNGSDIRQTETTEKLGLVSGELTAEVDRKTGSLSLLKDNLTGDNFVNGVGYRYETISTERITEFIRRYMYRFYDWSVNDFGRMNYPVHFEGKEYVPSLTSVSFSGDSIVCEYQNAGESVAEYGNANGVRVVYTVLGNRLNIRLVLSDKQASPIVEGGNFVFDLNFAHPNYTLNKVGELLDPAKDIAENANNVFYCLENYIDVSDGEKSLALVTHDAPLVSLGESGVYRFESKYVSRSDSKVFFNLFNNQWGTNFPQWTEGNFEYEFDLIPHYGSAADVSDRVYSVTERPLILEGCANYRLADSVLQIEGGKLVVIFSTENGIVVRIREDRNQKGTIRLSGALAEKKILKADSFGTPQQECGKEFFTEPCQVHTILIQ